MDKIDNLDKKILNIIMQNARIPSKDVAVQCGVSRAVDFTSAYSVLST